MVKAKEGDDVQDEAPTFRDGGKAAGANASSAGSALGLHASRKTVKKGACLTTLFLKPGRKTKQDKAHANKRTHLKTYV